MKVDSKAVLKERKKKLRVLPGVHSVANSI